MLCRGLIASLLCACTLATGAASQEPGERILVVGAGFSGLTAARLLEDSGFDVVVLEGKDRIGGRAWTVDLAGAPVDIGAMFLHGTEGHPGAAIAASQNLELHPRAQDLTLAYDALTHGPLSSEQLMSILVVGSVFESAAARLEPTLPADAALGDAVDEFLEQRDGAALERRLHRFGLEQLLIEIYDSGPPDETAHAHAGVYQELAGGDHLPAGGYGRLIDILAAGLDIRLETWVEAIQYGGDGVEVRTRNGTFEGDRVLVTVSQGVLESGAITFDPPLPAARTKSIERLDMGNLEKVIFVFDQPFWRETEEQSRSFLYIGENPGELPACLDFSGFVGKPSLTCLYGGQSARDLLAARSKAEVEGRAFEILAEIFGREIPQPIAVTSSRWLTDQTVLGSYSYFPVGSGPEDMIELGQPVGERLFFAGEATVPEYYGTVHGAMLSGIREAKRLGATRTRLTALCSHLPGC